LEKFKSIIKNLNVKLSFCINRLERIVETQKDFLPNYSKKNVVYKISCKDCDANYVGQTKRKLNTKISEHRNQVNRKSSDTSVITEHKLKHNYDFD